MTDSSKTTVLFLLLSAGSGIFSRQRCFQKYNNQSNPGPLHFESCNERSPFAFLHVQFLLAVLYLLYLFATAGNRDGSGIQCNFISRFRLFGTAWGGYALWHRFYPDFIEIAQK